MMRLMVTALLAGFIASAVAAEEDQTAQQEAPAPAVAEPVPAVAPPPAPASGVPPTAAPQPAPATTEAPAPEAGESVSKSSIPLEKRKGGDITKCLSDGVKTDKEIAACAEPYSPRHKGRK